MIVIAHRGASGYAPENTVEAFKKAVAMGARAFEFDVHLSADRKLVVHHNYDFAETAGEDRKIKDLSLEEIKKINVAKHFRPEGFASAPSLEEVLETVGSSADFINIEIKNDGNVYPGIEEELLSFMASRPEIMKKTVFSSFHFPTVKKLRALSPEARLSFLGHRLSTILLLPAILKAKGARCGNFHLSRRIAFWFNLKILIKCGFRVCVYTVNRRNEAVRFREWGIYGIFSDYPDVLERQD